jgi:periplasmic protein TonB
METFDAVFDTERQSHLPRWLVASVLLHLTVLSLLPGWRRGALHPLPQRLVVTLTPVRLGAALARPVLPQKPRVTAPAAVQHAPVTPARQAAHPVPPARRAARRQPAVAAEQVRPAPHVLSGDSGRPVTHTPRRPLAKPVPHIPQAAVPVQSMSHVPPVRHRPRLVPHEGQEAQKAPAAPSPDMPRVAPAVPHEDAQPVPSAARPPVPPAASDASPASVETGDNYAQLLAQEMDKYKKYPPVALMRGWQGKVVLQLRIAASRQILGAAVVRSSGYDVLDQAAVVMAQQLGRAPETAGYGHRPLRVKVAINFRISDQ